MSAGIGTFTWTGIAATLTHRLIYTLIASPGAFTETGSPAALYASHLVVTMAGTFTETGIAARLRCARKLTATAGTFIVTGLGVSFIKAFFQRNQHPLFLSYEPTLSCSMTHAPTIAIDMNYQPTIHIATQA